MGFKERLAAHKVNVLTLDIETSAHTVRTWGLFKQNIGLNQIVEPGSTLCLAYKWFDETETHFLRADEPDYAQRVWDLLDAAHYVVHWNGTSFDIPHLQKDLILAGLMPPSPFKQIDLVRVARKQFNFASNKLDWVAQQLGVGSKVKHEGFDLWTACEAGDPDAWKRMEEYNRGDIAVTEGLLVKLLPWIPNMAHIGMYIGTDRCCARCGNDDLKIEGYSYANSQKYILMHCTECGFWNRGADKIGTPLKTRAAS